MDTITEMGWTAVAVLVLYDRMATLGVRPCWLGGWHE
ncbi:hypothetical protein JOF53_006473 [Crossiella equi]|uniref:Uncharacterized protein n=1 Tax=Crossiella equi TaxID=130796 RepID=A0ABS5AM18_9PSEU|nr:hypothetical protein [Crossiella equi]